MEVFEPRALPDTVGTELHGWLEETHAAEPFSTLDTRRTARRVRDVAERVGLSSALYRGSLDLPAAEVDHVWLTVWSGDQGPSVLDLAFPLFADNFLSTLRWFIAGEVQPADLAAAANGAGVSKRVVGLFPAMVRYLGQPVLFSRAS